MRVEQGMLLSRCTSIGTGGPARAFMEPGTLEELEQAVRYGHDHGVETFPLGLGSNVLFDDAGVDAVVVRLRGDLAGVRVDGELMVAGGGATNAVCLHRARSAGLGGLEFASAIPGTAGGGVRMNAGAYGRDWSAILERALVVGRNGSEWLSAAELGLSYRHSELAASEVVAIVEYRLYRRDSTEIKAEVAELTAQRKATQPINKRTFGSVFKNPADGPGAGELLERCGMKGYRVGDAFVSERHANFIENAGGATTGDCVAVMVEGRRRVHEAFGVELAHEVVLVGNVVLPPLGGSLERTG